MFQTYLHARISSHPEFSEPQLWEEIEHDIHRPWFYVGVVGAFDEGLECRRMILVGHERSLQSLLQAQSSTWRVESVQVMTPSYVNGTDTWQLEVLDQLLVFADAAAEPTVSYAVQGGRVYVTGEAQLTLGGHSSELIYSHAMLKA